MDKSTYSLKNKILRNLPSFLGKLLYKINHKTLVYKESHFENISFSICIPHTMESNYNRGHETGVSKLIIDTYHSQNTFNFFDLGSCFGYYSALIHTLNPKSFTYAFEPYIGHNMYIEESMKRGLLKNIQLIKKPVGSKTIPPLISIDDFVSVNKTIPNLIKIDVDGAELDILKGCIETIEKHKPDFLIEIDGNQYKNGTLTLQDIYLQYFKGYTCSTLIDVHKNNTIWNQKKIDEINLKEIEGDVYLFLRMK